MQMILHQSGVAVRLAEPERHSRQSKYDRAVTQSYTVLSLAIGVRQ
jgi:hypothetical protein